MDFAVLLPGAGRVVVPLGSATATVADLKHKLWTGRAGLAEPEIDAQRAQARARIAIAASVCDDRGCFPRDDVARKVLVSLNSNVALSVPLPSDAAPLRAADALDAVLRAASVHDTTCSEGNDAARRFRLGIKETRTLLADDADVNGALGAPGAAQRGLLLLTAEQAAIMQSALAGGAPLVDGYPVFVALGVAGSGEALLRLMVSPAHTVGRLRKIIATKHAAAATMAAAGTETPAVPALPASPMRLLHAGQWLLDDDATLESVGVVRGSTVVVAGRAAGATAADALPLRMVHVDAEVGSKFYEAAVPPPAAASLPAVPLGTPIASLRELVAGAVSIPSAELELRLGDAGLELRDGDPHGACLLDYGAHAGAGALSLAFRRRCAAAPSPLPPVPAYSGSIRLNADGGMAGRHFVMHVDAHTSDTAAILLRKVCATAGLAAPAVAPSVGSGMVPMDGRNLRPAFEPLKEDLTDAAEDADAGAGPWLSAPHRRLCESGLNGPSAFLRTRYGWVAPLLPGGLVAACYRSLLHGLWLNAPGAPAERAAELESALARELALVARYGRACNVPADEYRCIASPGDMVLIGETGYLAPTTPLLALAGAAAPPFVLPVGAARPRTGIAPFTLCVRKLDGSRLELSCAVHDSVDDVKARIHAAEGIPADQQRLIAGKELRSGCCLADYDIPQHGAEVQLVLRLRGAMMQAVSGRVGYDELAPEGPDTDADSAAASIAAALSGGGGAGGAGGCTDGGDDGASEALEF